jgi:hypothetical protein
MLLSHLAGYSLVAAIELQLSPFIHGSGCIGRATAHSGDLSMDVRPTRR